ncbi:MAG: HAD-IA family hydrolase [Burkholderiales bacterium]|nr:HAD-IA family hydrolase [Burkholderiales bacterium]
MSIEALIFDVDGTLADTEETHRQAFNAAFLEHDLHWNWSPHQYVELLKISGGKERIARYIDGLNAPAAEKERLRGIVPGIHRTKTRIFAELIRDGRSPFRPGVARLVREAREAGVKLALASTTSPANVEALISAGLGEDGYHWFNVIACGDQVPAKKPAPDIYHLALSALGLPASACVAFEDSGNGVRAAKAAGLFTVVTPTLWTQTQDFTGADLVLYGLGDPAQPLDPGAAARIGAPCLGLAQLETLHAAAGRRAAAA